MGLKEHMPRWLIGAKESADRRLVGKCNPMLINEPERMMDRVSSCDPLLGQDEVHDPAAASVLPWLPAMGQDVLIDAARVHERVGKNRHAIKRPFVINRPRKLKNICGPKAGIDGNGSEGKWSQGA